MGAVLVARFHGQPADMGGQVVCQRLIAVGKDKNNAEAEPYNGRCKHDPIDRDSTAFAGDEF